MADSKTLTAAETADELHIHWRTLHRLRLRGEGPPAFKVGRVWRYRRDDLERWVRQSIDDDDRPPGEGGEP